LPAQTALRSLKIRGSFAWPMSLLRRTALTLVLATSSAPVFAADMPIALPIGGDVAEPPPPCPPPTPPGGALAVALEAEAAWSDPPPGIDRAPHFLKKAAIARAELGHKAHAAAYLRAYLADGRADPEAAALLRQLDAALVPLEIVLQADPKDTSITVQVEREGGPADVLPPLLVPLQREGDDSGRQRGEILVDAGRWVVVVPSDGYYRAQEVEVTVLRGIAPPPVEATLVGRDPRFIRVGVSASPFVLGAVGIGLTIGGHSQYRSTLREGEQACDGGPFQCRQLLTRAVTLRSTGAALLGASLGVGTALLSAQAGSRRRRILLWGGESILGLGAVIGGAIGVNLAARDFNSIPPVDWSDPLYQGPAKSAAARHSGAAFVLGYGASLFVYSVYYLMRDQINGARAEQHRRRDRDRPFALSPAGLAF
jgi:hypothetical protein